MGEPNVDRDSFSDDCRANVWAGWDCSMAFDFDVAWMSENGWNGGNVSVCLSLVPQGQIVRALTNRDEDFSSLIFATDSLDRDRPWSNVKSPDRWISRRGMDTDNLVAISFRKSWWSENLSSDWTVRALSSTIESDVIPPAVDWCELWFVECVDDRTTCSMWGGKVNRSSRRERERE